DVLWADSFAVTARGVLKQDEVEGVTVPDSAFVKNFESLSPKGISAMLDRLKVSAATGKGGGKAATSCGDKICGGQLEAGRITVAPSGQTLVLGGLTEIKGGDNISF